MNLRLTLGVLGSIFLCLGVFSPIVSLPLVGSLTYFMNGRGDGTIILILAGESLAAVIAKQYKVLWYTGLGCFGVMGFTFIHFQIGMSRMQSELTKELAGNPFRGLAGVALQSIQLQWGWALLLIGAGMVVAAAAMKESSEVIPPRPSPHTRPCPQCAEDIKL